LLQRQRISLDLTVGEGEEQDALPNHKTSVVSCCAAPDALYLINRITEILAMLLNDGISSKTGKQILQKETVNEMFRNQIPEYPNFGREGLSTAKPDITNSLPDIYPSSGVQGWGLTFMITGGPTGRSSGTAFWAGLPNLWWWCDRENGVAGMVSTQVLPFADSQVLDLLADVETIVYKAVV
jgi:hypothetical protein